MQYIGMVLIFMGLFSIVLMSSELIQEKILGKEINHREEKQKVKKMLPVSVVLILIGTAINIFFISLSLS